MERGGNLVPLLQLRPRTTGDNDDDAAGRHRQPAEPEEKVAAAVRTLADVAGQKQLTSYTEFNNLLSMRTGDAPYDLTTAAGRGAMAQLLGQSSRQTLRTHGVLISAVVTYLRANDADSCRSPTRRGTRPARDRAAAGNPANSSGSPRWYAPTQPSHPERAADDRRHPATR